MTPGSAGGKLGDHGALRRDEIIPLAADSTPSPNLPIPRPSHRVSAKPREEFEKLWLSSFLRRLSSARGRPCLFPPGDLEALPGAVIVEAMFS